MFSIILLPLIDSVCQPHEPTIHILDVSQDHEVTLEYGLPVDSFLVEENTIKAGSSLSTIINGLNIASEKVQAIISKASEVFDLKKIKQGNKYKVFHTKDSSEVNYLVYEQNATDYVLFNLVDSIHVEQKQKDIKIITKTACGTIESSLWDAVVNSGSSPMLALKLSDVYAWSVDFFGLQRGDQFKVYYEVESVEGEEIGISKIHAAWFKHFDKEYYAIPFYQDSILQFFDENGNSIKKAFLKAPLNYTRIASRFSHNRMHPILKYRRPHLAVDYSAPTGTPVQAIGDGTVIHAAYSGGAGNYVKIKHNSIYTTGYMHLSGYGKGIRNGTRVRQGDIIGYVGSTGLSTGPHLDFRVWKNGVHIDPLKLEAPPAEPVKEERMDFFKQIRDVWVKELNKLEIKDADVIAEVN
ncbi:MAG: peptidoglycan DD-metalloendopeptidase family protein [Chloroflexia bacterium]|nr:peptidoglycan DD-metalloendopeptidase family protein [Chloroflexia bacterium]